MAQYISISMAKTLSDYAKYEHPFVPKKSPVDCPEYYRGIYDACDFIKTTLYDVKPLDVVPVVRCRECRHYGYDVYGDGVCNLSEGLPFPEDGGYCSFGLRKKDGGGPDEP